jgi:formamidopyrimidine-DNA glycosylase
MPELPEVEWMARGLRSRAEGRVLDALEVRDAKLAGMEELSGQTLKRVERRGKTLVLHLGKEALLVHPRMTGRLVWREDERARLVFRFGGAEPISLVDPRRFGTVTRLPCNKVKGYFRDKKLGPEPWPEERNGAWWGRHVGKTRSPLKVALLRQELVAGLGNIAGSEICWRAGVHPATPAADLTRPQWENVARGARNHLSSALVGIGSELALIGEGGTNAFHVYGRAGAPCPVCAFPIERLDQAGRGTFYCPGCQRSPA